MKAVSRGSCHAPGPAFPHGPLPRYIADPLALSPESILGDCMERRAPGQAMELPEPDRPGYPSESHRPRALQRHHTIQSSDDAYVRPVQARSAFTLVQLCALFYPSPAQLGIGVSWVGVRPLTDQYPVFLQSNPSQQCPTLYCNPTRVCFQLCLKQDSVPTSEH